MRLIGWTAKSSGAPKPELASLRQVKGASGSAMKSSSISRRNCAIRADRPLLQQPAMYRMAGL